MSYNTEAIKIFKAFCDERRLDILQLLCGKEMCANELLEELNISQPTLSHHMKILCDAGIVTSRREGKWIYYHVAQAVCNKSHALIDELIGDEERKKIAAKPASESNATDGNVKPKVAFICIHNSCRSQIAEALGKFYGSDVFECYSAGTEVKNQINPDAVRMMKKIYGIDMEKTQRSKLLTEIPKVDIAVKMGCGVQCPVLFAPEIEDWGLEDPTGKSDEVFAETIHEIAEKVLALRKRILYDSGVITAQEAAQLNALK